MPKKTLREKLLAIKRREKLSSNFNISQALIIHPTTLSQVNQEVSVPQVNPAFTIKNTTSRQPSTTNYAYVTRDLKKIITISMFAFSFEGLLYFLLVKQFRIF